MGSKGSCTASSWDEAEVLLATRVIALCLEPVDDIWTSLATSLDLIAELYRARGETTKVSQLGRNAADARNGKMCGKAKCPRSLKDILDHLLANPLTGSPGQDWLNVRRIFQDKGRKNSNSLPIALSI